MADTVPGAGGGERLLQALVDLERRCLEHAAGLPKQEIRAEVWAGVLFQVGDVALVAPLQEIAEVLEVPRDITPVHGTRPWVRGVANNRGTLLPIFDLQAFLFGSAITLNPRTRVLVVRQEELPYGLMVRDVIGIRHFDISTRTDGAPEVRGVPEELVTGGFASGSQRYAVFSTRDLALDTRFRQAAA